jgi:serine/threonine protein kinase
MIAAELAVSSMLSDLARRGICPNFVLTRGVFNCPYPPPESHWGNEFHKAPKGNKYVAKKCNRLPRQPTEDYPGRFHYIRMELCDRGDAEEFIKAQPDATISPHLARSLLFQTAFALHAAAERCSMKHYDIKLLNLFLQRVPVNDGEGRAEVVLRYGLGSHVFSLRMQAEDALFAKLADYETANVKPESNGQPVTIGQFTTIENTPPDFMILGDRATQGHGHDNWGLGLSMLHLFTGDAPYEEIMEGVVCPPGLKKRLRHIWEEEGVEGYEVIRSVILADVELDEAGHIIEGEPDETAYDTLYRALVLFGVPNEHFRRKERPKVWDAIVQTLLCSPNDAAGKGRRRKMAPDASRYISDCRKFSIRTGNNKSIARARAALESMDGGLDLLFGLCNFNPAERFSAMDVMNSSFMAPLREESNTYDADATVYSFTAFSTHY